MQLRSFIVTCLVLTASMIAQAQQQFITHGKIEYERKVNQHSMLEEGSIWNDVMKKNTPKFHTAYYDLYFKDGLSLYKTGREPEVRQNKVWTVFIAENTIQTNLDSSKTTTLKDIQNDLYLLTDSVRKIDWKIGTEIRKIAGFDCRKAVGRIMDSIVVIAFYAEEVLPSGGPESFNGLPGMILGLAIPRLHTTWYATKLELIEVTDKDLAAPKKGKKYTNAAFQTQLRDIMKDWGDEGKRLIPQILL
ncbi:GLPGLI family protein [Pseudoflavitalea sp. X16]|uniref:GLPGLI family protein n=1 Tax=Paraflavitalea devenefica TaxID=2716334 RepID=UPI00141F3FC6|nr:GLPGLI family protein [Paraflavitalea devenefica]NII28947.1 GLPGLI family protein [Paraflavitalea devenefica]